MLDTYTKCPIIKRTPFSQSFFVDGMKPTYLAKMNRKIELELQFSNNSIALDTLGHRKDQYSHLGRIAPSGLKPVYAL